MGLISAGLLLLGLGTMAQPPAEEKSRPQAEAPAQKPAPRAGGLFARVVDEHGRGVPGVRVHALGLREREALTFTSDTEGLVHLPADQLGAPGRFLLTASPNKRTLGWVQGHRAPNAPAGTAEDPWILTLLPRTRTVEGRVLDRAGRPIAGSRVRVQHLANSTNGRATWRSFGPQPVVNGWPDDVVTDERGWYSLTLPEKTTLSLTAAKPGFVGPSLQLHSDEKKAEPLSLVQAGSLVGVVKDADTGKPVPGAFVGAQLLEHRRPVVNGAFGEATTDAQGRYAMGLEPGVYNLLFLQGPESRRFTAVAVELVRVRAGQDTRADLTMIEGRRLHGTVVDGETGEGQANVQIGDYGPARPRSGAAVLSTRTDAPGEFDLYVPPGQAYVYLMERGRGPFRSRTSTIPESGDPEPARLVVSTRQETEAALKTRMEPTRKLVEEELPFTRRGWQAYRQAAGGELPSGCVGRPYRSIPRVSRAPFDH